MRTQRSKGHVLFISILFCTAVFLDIVIYIYYDELYRQPIVINKWIQISPIYNKSGTWLHEKMGIGYLFWLLYLESILSLILLAVITRYMEIQIYFFKLSPKWLYLADIGVVPGCYRMFTRARGAYTLDYLQINQMVYDFSDLCIGVFAVGIFIWVMWVSWLFYQYRKEKQIGMNFIERMVWGIQFRRMMVRLMFLPRIQWQREFKKWEANSK